MEYLEKLLRQFSDTPQNLVLHADILRRGVKSTPDLKRAGAKSCQTGISTKLQMMILDQTELPPSQFHFRADETTVDIRIDEGSPYEIREDEQGAYHLFCGTENFGEVRFTKRPSYADRKTSDGQECPYLLMQRGPFCLLVSPLDMCAYLKRDEACKYCVLSAAMELGIKQGIVTAVPDYKILAEAVAIACEDMPLKDLKICGGALYDVRKEAAYYKRCLAAVLERVDAPEEITVFSQAFEKEDQKEFKEMGATNVCFNLEVWNEHLWPKLLPGKARAVGRDEWIRRLEDAVEIFGRGHVGTSFVGGFECAPKPGYLDREEALKSYVSGFEFLIERGIVPWFTVWTATPLVGDFDVDDPPPTEFYLRLGLELHELLDKHGLYADLGFSKMGEDPPTLGLYCYYCFSMSFTRDYPRLIGRKQKASASVA